ncbi:hypothetical protein Peur_024402 [Populus x canadensis]
MLIKLTKKQKFAYLVLETEDAYSADGSSPAASLCLPSALTCLHVPFFFSATFEAEKVMKRPTCSELVLIPGLSLSAGTKVIAKPILLSVLLLYFSFSFLRFFLFYPLVFLPVRGLLCFCSSSLYYLCSCVLWCSQCYFLSSGLFPFLVLCPIFSVQDGDNGGKSTRCCWLMDQNFPLVLFLSQSFFVFPWFFRSFPWVFFLVL